MALFILLTSRADLVGWLVGWLAGFTLILYQAAAAAAAAALLTVCFGGCLKIF